MSSFSENDLDVVDWVAQQRVKMAEEKHRPRRWRCASCGAKISNAKNGWVQWFEEDGWLVCLRVVCRECVLHGEAEGDHHLDHFLSRRGQEIFFDYLIGKKVKEPAEIWRLAVQIFAPASFAPEALNATP